MKKLISIMRLPYTIAVLYFLLLPGLSVSQLDLILYEVDPGYSANHIAEDFEENVLQAGINFIRKYNPTLSAYMWTTTIQPAEGSTGYASIQDMTIDGNGNSYLTGTYVGSIAFGSTILTSLVNSQHIYQKSDLFVTKLDPNGNFLWAKSFGTNTGTDRSNAIALDGLGNIYITGLFCNKICSGPSQGSAPEIEDIYVAKLNNSGNLVWQKRFAPSKLICENYGIGYDITVDGSGNIFATGSFRGTFKFGNTSALTLTSQGQGDVFTIKLNNTGTPIWARAGHGAASDSGQSLYVDAGGNINVGGHYGKNGTGSISFTPFTLADVDGNAGAPGPAVSNAFLVRYTSAGNLNWAINPAPVTGVGNEVQSIIAGPAGTIRALMPSIGIKSFSATGTETEFISLEDNFTPVGGYPYPKSTINDMEAATSGFIVSENIRCGSVTMANLILENQHCQDCADWYTCDAPNHSDLYIIRSASPPAVNAPVISRSTPEIEGHIYLGTFNGHTYYRSDCLATSWIQAQEAATEMGGYLATITSEAEDCFLAPYTPSYEPQNLYGGAWIGLRAYEQNDSCDYWQWLNEEPFGYENWVNPGVYVNNVPIFCGQPVLIGRSTEFFGQNPCNIRYGWIRHPYVSDGLSWYIVEFDSDPGCSNPNKTYVCHNGNTLCINVSSLQNHLDHGDYAGPCGPCNSNYATVASEPSDYAASNEVPMPFGKDDHQDRFDKNTASDLTVYPNPASNEIRIQFPSTNDVAMLRIFDMMGKLVYSDEIEPGSVSEKITINTNFGTGLHFIHFNSGNNVWTKPFLVENE